MAKMIKIPGVGPVKSTYVYVGLGVTAGIVALAYWRRSQGSADDGTGAVDELVTDDFAQTSDGAGFAPFNPTQYAPYGYDLYGNPLPPPVGGGSGGPYTTNRDWAAAATETLEGGGATTEVASTAVSAVLGGLSVTSAQRDMFLRAAGVLGEPPQGYPKPIHVLDTPAQPGPPTPGTPSTGKPGKVGGLRATGVGRYAVDMAWGAVSGASGYHIYSVGGSGRQHIGQTASTHFKRNGLRKGTRYSYWVAAFNGAGIGPLSSQLNVTTKR